MRGNILVKAGAAFLVVVVILVAMKKSDNQSSPEANSNTYPLDASQPVSAETLAALGLEGDTEQDTVRTLIGEVRKLKSDLAALRSDNIDLRDDNAQLRAMEDTLSQRVVNEINQAVREQEMLTRQRLNELSSQNSNRYQELINRVRKEGATTAYEGQGGAMEGIVWVSPLTQDSASEQPGQTGQPRGLFQSLPLTADSHSGDQIGIDALPGVKGRHRKPDKATPEPVFTLPKNATLVGSTAFTALVGRVPVGSNVVDPYSFKVIIGKDNLAANGSEIPDVAYAVASGQAVGDWTLGCVRGELYSITFVFTDGTIRTVPQPKDITQGSNRTQDVAIGELADNYGNPCVVGKRISNAYSYLAQRIGVSAAGAAAEAAAASETSTLTTTSGGGLGSLTVVDGDRSNFIVGRTLADSSQEVADWLDQRQSQHFDAIYVPPGETVAIHITEEIRIDYDRHGRKTHHTPLAFGGDYRALD